MWPIIGNIMLYCIIIYYVHSTLKYNKYRKKNIELEWKCMELTNKLDMLEYSTKNFPVNWRVFKCAEKLVNHKFDSLKWCIKSWRKPEQECNRTIFILDRIMKNLEDATSFEDAFEIEGPSMYYKLNNPCDEWDIEIFEKRNENAKDNGNTALQIPRA